jgi:5'-nucleotidase
MNLDVRDRRSRSPWAALLATGVLLATTILASAAPVAAKPAGTVDFWLTVLHNNDGETKLLPQSSASGPFAGVARFKTLVDELKAEALSVPPGPERATKRGVVMLSSGDNFLAGAEWTASLRTLTDADESNDVVYDAIAMSLVGYDAIAIGNHEFDFGPDILAGFIAGFTTPTPFVSANLDLSGEPELAALEAAGRIAPSTIVKERGESIGIIGATTPQLPNISSPRDVVVGAVAPAVLTQVAALEAQGVDKIILISHLQSVAEDLALAGELSGVDVMIAGGGDELLANADDPLAPGDGPPAGSYPLTATDADGVAVPVITTSGDYKYVGRLVVGFDKTGAVVDVDQAASGPVRVVGFGDDAVAPDPTVQAEVVDPVQAFVNGLAANIIATSEVPLNGLRGTVDASQAIVTAGVRNSETNLGDLTADSMLWQAQQKAAAFAVDSPQVALQNGGGIRNNSVIPAGPISELNTFQILAFTTNFVSIKEDITAERFKAILETSVSEIGNGRFGQWAGVTLTYDPAAQKRVIDSETCAVTDPGNRVKDVFVGGTQIFDEGVFVGPAGWTVDLASNDFTFRGGDCYDFGPGGFTTVGVIYQQALLNFLTAPTADGGLGGVIGATDYPVGGEGRIVRL